MADHADVVAAGPLHGHRLTRLEALAAVGEGHGDRRRLDVDRWRWRGWPRDGEDAVAAIAALIARGIARDHVDHSLGGGLVGYHPGEALSRTRQVARDGVKWRASRGGKQDVMADHADVVAAGPPQGDLLSGSETFPAFGQTHVDRRRHGIRRRRRDGRRWGWRLHREVERGVPPSGFVGHPNRSAQGSWGDDHSKGISHHRADHLDVLCRGAIATTKEHLAGHRGEAETAAGDHHRRSRRTAARRDVADDRRLNDGEALAGGRTR